MKCERLVFQPLDIPDERSGDVLSKILAKPNWTDIFVLSAYALFSGVQIISASLQASTARKTAIIGVGNGVTTEEAMKDLLSAGCDIWAILGIVGTSIFHPKLIIAKSATEATIVIGSVNLTFPAQQNNIEASAIITLDLSDAADSVALAQLEAKIQRMLTAGAPFADRLRTNNDIANYRQNGLLESEATVRRSTGAQASKVRTGGKISNSNFPYKIISRRRRPRPRRGGIRGGGAVVGPVPTSQLVWRKGNLPASDAQQTGAHTNPTGNLRLSQAGFIGPAGLIDNKTYFRRQVFAHLQWHRQGNVERAKARFRIAVRGVQIGIYDLDISHARHRIAHQGNVPTVLHWGPAIPSISAAGIVGSTLSIYGPDSTGVYDIDIR